MANERATQQNQQRRRAVLSVCFVLLLMLVVLAGATVFLWVSLPSRNVQRTSSVPLFGVQEITVAGDTRYDTDDIVSVSGIREGQSIFSLNKLAAHDAILRSFPYIETVEIFNTSINKVEIRVTEANVLGALYADGAWLVVSENGKGLETLPLQGDTPPRHLYLKGAALTEDAGVGKPSLDERCSQVIATLMAAFEQYEFSGVEEIDVTDLSDIRLRLNNRITIKMGNSTQLNYQVAVLADSLEYVYQSYGEKAEGMMDISSYADEESNDMVVFTPQDTLDRTTTTASTTTTAASGDTANGTTAASSATQTGMSATA